MDDAVRKGSYEKINYALRPAKSVERKMLVEAFRRLAPFGRVADYRYVGFGSTYFSDFLLFHRSLGIRNMISIERDEENAERFLFNRPFQCITMRFGESGSVLPTLPWDVRTIIWLDFDGRLSHAVLDDVRTVVGALAPGSMLVVSVNANPLARPHEVTPANFPEWRLLKLRAQVGDGNVPLGLDGRDLSEWGTAAVYHRILTTAITETITIRNGGRDEGARLLYRQMFHFAYSDNAKMLTVGGVVIDRGQENLLSTCGFGDLPFVRTGAEPFHIRVPNLTLREIRHLDSLLPASSLDALCASVPTDDVEAYSELYRYFPHFAETDL